MAEPNWMNLLAIRTQSIQKRRGAAPGNDFPGASLTLPALGRYAKGELDVIEVHSRAYMPCDFAVGHPAAYTNDHRN